MCERKFEINNLSLGKVSPHQIVLTFLRIDIVIVLSLRRLDFSTNTRRLIEIAENMWGRKLDSITSRTIYSQANRNV